MAPTSTSNGGGGRVEAGAVAVRLATVAAAAPGRLEAGAVLAGRAAAMVPAGLGCVAVAAGSNVMVLHLGSAPGIPPTSTLLRMPPASAGKPIVSLAASRDGRLIAAGEKGSKPALWLFSGSAVPEYEQAVEIAKAQHNFSVAALAFSPSGRLLASHGGDRDHQIVVWAPAMGGAPGGMGQQGRLRLKEAYDALEFVGEDRVAAISRENLTVWTLERDTMPGSLPLKLSVRTCVLPTLGPASTRMLGLVALGSSTANPRAPLRLVSVTSGGRLLRLKPSGAPVEKSLELPEVAQVLALAASADHVAVACPSGIKLFSSASLELVAELALPAAATSAAASWAEACAFGADGRTLTACTTGGGLLTWDLQDVTRPTLLHQRQLHSEAITDVISIPTAAEDGTHLATCGLDGRILFWRCSGPAQLSCAATLDIRAHLGSTKLNCVAASPDGSLLASGDNNGNVHLVSLALRAPSSAPTLVASLKAVLDGTEVTALAFGMGFPASSADQHAPLLLAVGGRRGTVKVLGVKLDGSCSLLASLADHRATVSGIVFTSSAGSSSTTGLATADSEGKRQLYRWDPTAGQLRLSATAAVPRNSFVDLVAANAGQVLVSASKTGKAYTWEGGSGTESGSVQLLDRSHGEITCMDADRGAGLVVCAATSRNHLLVFSLPGGKLLASGKAHAAGSSINKVLILPGAGCVVSVGSDTSVVAHLLPASLAATCRQAVQGLTLPTLPSAPATFGSSSAGSARVKPRDLTALIDEAASSPEHDAPAVAEMLAVPEAPSPAYLPAPDSVLPFAVDSAAAAALVLPDGLPAGLPLEPAEVQIVSLQRTRSILPSPNRQAVLGGREQHMQQLDDLQAIYATLPKGLPARRGTATQEQVAEPASPAAVTAPPAPAAASTPPPASPGLDFGCEGSPYETISNISPGWLQSPDVFADLGEGPEPGGTSLAAGVAANLPQATAATDALHAAADVAAAASAADPAKPPVSAHRKASLQRLATTVLGWRGFRASGGSVQLSAASEGALDPLAAADAARCRALLHLSAPDSADVAGPTTLSAAAASPAREPDFFSPTPTSAGASVTVDVGAQDASPAGSSASVSQPRRRPWGPVPGSNDLTRRALSATSLASLTRGSAAQPPRPHSSLSLGGEVPFSPGADSWGVYEDAGSTAKAATPADTAGGDASAATSRRLTFSFGFGGARQRTNARTAQSKEEDTPTLPTKAGAKPAAAAPLPLAFNPATYHSPGLPATGAADVEHTDRTPRLFLGWGRKPSGAPPQAVPDPLSVAAVAVASRAATDAGLASVGSCIAEKPRSLQGRPPVPRLNLSAASLSSGRVVAPGIVSAKRSRLSREAAALPAESSANMGSARGGDRQPANGARRPLPAVAEPDVFEMPAEAGADGTPTSKKSKPAVPSPPRLIITSALFSYSPEQAKAAVCTSIDAPGSSGSSQRTRSIWSLGAGSVATASLTPCVESLGGTDDPFSRPPAHDPLEDEETPSFVRRCAAALLVPVPGPLASFVVCTGLSAGGAWGESPPCKVSSSHEAAPPAFAGPEAEAGADTHTPRAAEVLSLLRRGVQGVSSLAQAAGGSSQLDPALVSELRGLLASFAQAVGLPPPAPPATAAAPTVLADMSGQENTCRNGHAGQAGPTASAKAQPGSGHQEAGVMVNQAQLAALKHSIMQDLRLELAELCGGK